MSPGILGKKIGMTQMFRADGQAVPVMAEQPGTNLQPPLLSGHNLETPSQVVLGTITLAALHKHVGDFVIIKKGVRAPIRLQIVGTASKSDTAPAWSEALRLASSQVA